MIRTLSMGVLETVAKPPPAVSSQSHVAREEVLPGGLPAVMAVELVVVGVGDLEGAAGTWPAGRTG
jgi:hypothetical protein